MIASIKGKVISKSANGLVVEVNDIGYEVFVDENLLVDTKVGERVNLFISEYVREDQFSLFGFTNEKQKKFYNQLVAISGVGPKMAMAIISTDSVENLQKAALTGKIDAFKRVLGVGSKTAQRIIIELKGRVDFDKEPVGSKDPTYQALISLGYNSSQANDAIKNLPDDLGVNERVKLALKELSK